MSDTAQKFIKAEQDLADMIARDLNVIVDPIALGLFIRLKWKRVSNLCHDIHRKDVLESHIEASIISPSQLQTQIDIDNQKNKEGTK